MQWHLLWGGGVAHLSAVHGLAEIPDDPAGACPMLRVLAVVAHLADVTQLPLQVLKRVHLLGNPEDLQIQKGEHCTTVGVGFASAAEQHPDLRERHSE